MNTRISETSVMAHEAIKPEKANQCSIIQSLLQGMDGINHAKDIARKTGLKYESVTARINEMMYEHQTIKVAYVANNRKYYCIRTESDPINIRPKSQAEVLADKINAIQAYLGLSDAQLEAIIQQGKNNLFAKV